MDGSHEELIAQFSGITGTSPTTAQTALTAAEWNLEQAVSLYYASQDAPEADDDDDDGDIDLDETTAAQPPAPSSSSNRPPPQQSSRMRTIKDLQDSNRSDAGSDSEDDKQDFFAGGEKSGLAVQNPNNNSGPQDHFRNIMQQAKENRARPGGEDEEEAPSRSTAFSGRAQTLGGDDAPSQVIEDPSARSAPSTSALPKVSRTLHLWQDGFSVDDGPLHRFDDPANAPVLALINQGRAPLALLNVQPGQEVDLQLDPHKDEKYVLPKQKYKPFAGSGQRLGSPTPAASSSTPPPPPPQAQQASASASTPSVNVDPSQPAVQLQIRLGDGSRLVSRFNTSHTVGDIYTFVTESRPESAQRGFQLMTTFPSKPLDDKTKKLEDLEELKKGGVVVQKWT